MQVATANGSAVQGAALRARPEDWACIHTSKGTHYTHYTPSESDACLTLIPVYVGEHTARSVSSTRTITPLTTSQVYTPCKCQVRVRWAEDGAAWLQAARPQFHRCTAGCRPPALRLASAIACAAATKPPTNPPSHTTHTHATSAHLHNVHDKHAIANTPPCQRPRVEPAA